MHIAGHPSRKFIEQGRRIGVPPPRQNILLCPPGACRRQRRVRSTRLAKRWGDHFARGKQRHGGSGADARMEVARPACEAMIFRTAVGMAEDKTSKRGSCSMADRRLLTYSPAILRRPGDDDMRFDTRRGFNVVLDTVEQDHFPELSMKKTP